ncbi:unnamed protein product [Schistosoma rodhaini]|nr:unnamed protein product [Schistosoma rodhaini]
MSGFVNVLVFCDHRDSFSVELDYLKKRFVDDSGSTKIIALCDYFSDHLISKHELLSDIFLTFLDLISAHNIIAFFVSQFTFEPCKCLPNKHPELDSFITKSSFEPDIPQHSHCTTESPFTCCTLMELLPFFDYERLLGTLRFKKMLYFFKKPSVNFKGSLSRQDILRSLLSGNGLDVYDYEDYKFTGFVLENELLKLKQTSHLRPLSCEGKENHGPKSEFILPRHIKKLEDILDRFCLSASKDENDSIPSVNNILDLYVLEDWSCKLKRSDQRLRNISTKFQHDSSRNRILLISGQPGVGKTRFLTSWLNKRKSDGFTFMNDHIKVKELTTITDADETTNNSLKTESDIIFIDEFIEPGKCNSDIWQLLDDLNRKARTARYKKTEVNQEFNLHSLFKYRVQIVKDRLRNPIINKLHKYWCLKENALAQKIFIHELYITSFGFDANNNHKNIFNWDDYIERLLATQSIRQLLLCLLQQWAIEFEYNIITKEKELSLRNSMENSEGHSTLSTFNDDKQASDHKINFKALLQTSTTQLSKDWTVGLVGLVFHTLVAAFRFTWTNEKMYQEDENSGFKFQDVLHVLKNINLPKYYVIRSILPSTVMALHSPLLGYYCLRILHRAGAFSQTTEGGVLHQTNLDGYLKFNHEIIYSVVRQLLARDNGATGIHLPFITTALKWSTGGEQGNTLSNILSHRHLQTVSKASNQSLSNYSLSLIEKNLYKSKPKITFKKTGRIIQAALSLTQSGDTFSINNQFTNEKKSLNKINDNDTVVIPISIKRSSSLRASLQLVPDIYRIALKSNDLLDNNDVNYSTSQLSSDNCAYTRHILLLTEIMNYLVIKPNYPVTYGFLTRLVITQIEMICIVNNLNGVKIILNNLEFILLHPCFLLCLAFPTYATEVFTGSIQNSHLLVALWQTIQNSFMLIDKYHENDKNNDKTSLFENDVRSSIGKLNCSHENSFNIANASYNFSGDNTTMKRSITKLNELAQRVLDHVESKKYTKENCSDSPNICNSFSQLNDLSGENNLESLVWIIGELIYYLGDELVSVQILSKLAVCFINRETLCKSDILQLSHLGLNIMNKLRYLRNEVNESIDNQLMLYQSIVYETEMTITEWLKESFILTLCDTEENRLTERRIFTALAYIKMYRLESVIGLTESSNEQLNLFEYQICQTIRDIKQFNSQLIDRTLLAIGMYLLAKIRLLQMNTSEHEFLMFQAISECMADQGEYHPLIAEWLIILALSLQKPPNGDNNELDEVNFLRMKFGRTRAQECLRWSLDIMTYNQEILIRPVIPPPTSVLSNFNQHIYKKLHRSILLRLPRYLIIPQIQPSLLSPFLSESSRSTSYNLNSSTGRKVSNPSSNRTDITLNFNNQHLFSNPYVYQTLPAEICLQLVICLLKDKRQISLQEAITRAAFVLHERILFLGVDHPATIQISKILDHIEHYLIHGWTSNETRDKEVKLTKSKLLNDRKSGYLFSTNRPHDELFGRNQSTQHTRLSSRNSLFDEQMSKDHVSTRATSRAEQLPSKRLDRKQLKISNTFKISKYESNLKYLGKIHYFLSKKINQTSNTRKYTN